MKKILITGKNSYIGTKFIEWIKENNFNMTIYELDVKDDNWIKHDFSNYDAVLHVAGIAHRKETKENEQLYYQVNRDLAFNVAKKTKKDGVGHFVFLSTMSVYGKLTGKIDEQTSLNPVNNYGKAKLEAEEKIKKLGNKDFIISILRPPMVYGKNAKGNYNKLSSFIKKTKLFPNINNKRSMIHIYNLCEFIRLVIENRIKGLLFPQNDNYVNVKSLAKLIGKYNRKKIHIVPNLFHSITLVSKASNTGKKVLGDLYYEQKLSSIFDHNNNKLNYNVVNFENSIKETERNG